VLHIPIKLLAAEPKMSLTFGVFTRHLDSSEDINENNRLIAFSYKKWCAAWFENSYYKDSFFFGRAFQTDKRFHKKYKKWFTRVGIYTGAVYGYGDKIPIRIKGISPYLLPTASLGYDRYSFELGFIPCFDSGVIVGMFKVEF
jgi:hypothetical protein